jgi:class 3 adenylate cyclase/tetratricopeptide (TPR) repeat protein
MTVMFVDLVDSTAMAERHEPEVVYDVVRRYQEVCACAVAKHRGHIAGYAGDGVMAYFGFPAAREDDARQATLAGLDIVAELAELAAKTDAEHGIRPAARVGIHTGLVLLTEMGSAERPYRDAIVGPAPNQAARIQSVAPAGGVVISDATYEIVRGYFEVQSLGRPPMKGVHEGVEVFRVLRATQASDRLQAAGRALTPLVGRVEELHTVRDQWSALERSSGGPTCFVLLRGEAGIGKSRIAAQIVREALADGFPVFLGMCAADRTTSPLHPVVRLLEAHFGFEPDDDDATKLHRIERCCTAAGLPQDGIQIIAGLLEVPTGHEYAPLELEPRTLRERTFEAVTALVLAMADRRRTLLVIDDLQWSDQSTLELLCHFADTKSGRGLLVMATSRREFEPPWSNRCSATIEVGPLQPDDHTQLIRELAGIHAVPQDCWEVIARRSDGNPLFTEELARAVDRDASLDVIPTTIRDLLTARLDALGRNKQLAQLASTLGREVDIDLLRTVSDTPRRQLTADLQGLVRAGILEELARPEGAVTHRFVHALVRDAAYDSQERLHDRRSAHLRVARALVGRPGADAGVVAQHFDAAHSLEDAVPYYVVAAAAAQQAAAHVEATRLLDRALELTERLPEGPLRDSYEINVRILRGLSTIHTQGYAAPGAAEDYGRGLELSGRAGNDIALFTATVGISAFYAVHGDLKAAGEAVARLQAMRQSEVEAEVSCLEGVQRFYEGRFPEAAAAFEAALAAFERRRPEERVSPRWQLPSDPYVATLVHLGPLLWLMGDNDRAWAMVDAACRQAAELPFPSGPFSQGYVMTYAGWLANLDGRFGVGLEFQERILEISARHGTAFWNATAVCHGAISRAAMGDPEAATEVLASGIAMWRGLGAEAFVTCLLTELASIRLAAGHPDAALDDVDQAIELSDRTGEQLFLAESHRVRAAVLRARGASMSDIRQVLEASRRTAAAQRAVMFEVRALIDLVSLDESGPRPDEVRDLRRLVASLPPASRPAPDVIRARELIARLI